jgi:LuxR family transcriptional regulator, maltose regulon positive regulatory protein
MSQAEPRTHPEALAAPPLLSAKYRMPSLRPNLVARPRLLQKLNAPGEHRLTLLSAPPGFGKTTLVAGWLAGDGAPAGGTAWLTLDAADDDPNQFLFYLITALQQVSAGIGALALQALRSPQSPPPAQALVAMLLGELGDIPVRVVLDDYHVIEHAAVHQILQLLVEHLPSSARLILLTREDPPLPLPRLRARGQIVEIRERDLRFTREEAAAFLGQTMALNLTASSVDALATRTEGWITGLQLGALVLQESAGAGAQRLDKLAADFTGDDRYVIDYLMSEVLDHQPESTRAFLTQTAILDQFTAGLCDAVTGRDDSRAVLEQLEQRNLFLVPLDHRREWYRYHHLFSAFLRAQAAPALLAACHQRAAGWFESQGLIDQAVQHGLIAARTTGEWGHVAGLIRAAADDHLQSGAVTTSRAWLNALPLRVIDADCALATQRAWVNIMQGDLAGAGRDVEIAQCCAETAPAVVRGKLLTVRAILAMGRHDDEQVIALAEQALAALGDAESRWRTITLWELAEAQERTRPIAQAITSLQRIRAARSTLSNPFFAPAIDSFLAAALDKSGARRAALAVCEQRLARHASPAESALSLDVMVLAQQALLHLEGNEVNEATHYAERAVASAERLGIPALASLTTGSAALVAHARGQTEQALALLSRAIEPASSEDFGDTGWLRAAQAGIYLQWGDVEHAGRWAVIEGLSADDEPAFLNVDALLVYSRLLLAQDRLPEAARLLARLVAFLEARGLQRDLISAQLLQAQAAELRGESATARDLVAQVLQVAVPEGYARRCGDAVAASPRLRATLAALRYVAPEFVDRVLAQPAASTQAYAPAPAPPSGAATWVEPLSEREQEIVRLLDRGLSNADMARRLSIAAGTVKRHLNNIYGKLGVQSRTQAIARARELGLL